MDTQQTYNAHSLVQK